MYELVRGPLTWIAFAVFFAGTIYRLASMLWLARRDKVVYPTFSLRHGLRSLCHWVLPFGSRSMRIRPFFTVLSFAFHVCLLLTPLLAMGHAVLWQESWGVRWWSLPPAVADGMTLVVIAGGLVFLLRRIASPEVRRVSTAADVLLLLLVIAPFVTGFIAHQQWFSYRVVIVLHVITGALWLVAIPFTRLAHAIWFALTRSYMGSEFGSLRQARDW